MTTPDVSPAAQNAKPSNARMTLAVTPINPDAEYAIPQVLAWAGMSSSTFYRLIKAGAGPNVRKRGRRSLVRGSDFVAWRDTVQ